MIFVAGEILLNLSFGNLIEFGSCISFLSVYSWISLDHLVCQSSSTDATSGFLVNNWNRTSTVLPQNVTVSCWRSVGKTLLRMRRSAKWQINNISLSPHTNGNFVGLAMAYGSHPMKSSPSMHQPLYGKRRIESPPLLYLQYIGRLINRDVESLRRKLSFLPMRK